MLADRNIVIAEDNPILRNLLAEIFRECGWAVRAAEDGLTAMQTITEEAPAMLLSDLEMDNMSGFEMLSIVRRRFPSIKVVAMSGAFSGTAVPAGVAADFFYAKGGSVSTLLDIIAELGGKHLSELERTSVSAWLPNHNALSSSNGRFGISVSIA
jgi:CheY-like chemotaxis protein